MEGNETIYYKSVRTHPDLEHYQLVYGLFILVILVSSLFRSFFFMKVLNVDAWRSLNSFLVFPLKLKIFKCCIPSFVCFSVKMREDVCTSFQILVIGDSPTFSNKFSGGVARIKSTSQPVICKNICLSYAVFWFDSSWSYSQHIFTGFRRKCVFDQLCCYFMLENCFD
jgi:hypothetical protein